MSNHPIPDGDLSPAGRQPPTTALLRQAIEHVDQLLDRLDQAPPKPADATPATPPSTISVPDAPIATRIAAVASYLSGPPAQALAGGAQLMLLARDVAERMRSQARQSSIDAALAGQRIITDATRAAAQLQADAKRNEAACEAWANELTCAADAAIHTIIGHAELTADQSTPTTSDNGPADPRESPPRPDLEAAIDAAVQEMDAVEFGRRRRTRGRR